MPANDYLDDFATPVVQRHPYIVYVKTNSKGYITAVNSSVFLNDKTGWREIDSGYGTRYGHAQGNYFPEPIFTMGGAYRYKLVDGKPVECTADEIAKQEQANKSGISIPTHEERIASLEEENAILMECLLEMSALVYA